LRLFIGAQSRKSSPSDIRDFSVEQLQFVPKAVLLRVCGDYVQYLWNKLPEYIKSDFEVQTYRRCYEHYNRSWQRTHIDGSIPLIKDCHEYHLLQQRLANQ